MRIPSTAGNRCAFAVTANFTAEPLGDSLRFWLARLGLDGVRVEFSGYNQVFQELVAPDSLLASNLPGVNLILIRFEDWGREQAQELRSETIATAAREFVANLTAFAQRARRPTVVALCPPSRAAAVDPAFARVLNACEEETRRALPRVRGVSVITPEETEAWYPVAVVEDPVADRTGHIPFTAEYWAALGAMLMRRARVILQPPHKVIAVDADNTLWGGVVGEVGAAQVDLTGAWRAIQEFLRDRKNRGMLLALVSKNNESDIADVFRRPEMILSREDFVAWKVNWEPKSQNIAALAKELDLGLDGFVFLDDNPVECAEVAANCPAVSAALLPADPGAIPNFLIHVWAFDLGKTTAVDAARTELYRQQSERNRSLASARSFAEFIEGLNLQVNITPTGVSDYERAAQLLQRTNQFNTTTIRRTATELASLLESGARHSLLVRVRDRFGDYGEVGLAVYFRDQEVVCVETLLLSCRVLGKGVEHRILAALGEEALRLGVGSLIIPYKPTERNHPIEKFFGSLACVERSNGAFRLTASAAAATRYEPGSAVGDNLGGAVEAPSQQSPTADFLSIALELNSAERIAQAVARYHHRKRPQLPGLFVPARSEQERKLVKIWEEVLRIDPIGVTDSFLNLGGQSLQAVSIASRIESEFGIRIPLSLVLSAKTIAELRRHLDQAQQGAETPLPKAKHPALSAAQQRLWFLDQFIPNRSAYNIPHGWRIRGALKLAALTDAFSQLAMRHETLRSSLSSNEGATGLMILDTPAVPLRHVIAGSESEALALAIQEACCPFDLTQGSVFRSLVITVAPDDHILVTNVHHIAADGWSMGVLVRDLADAYAGVLGGHPQRLRPLPASYADYAAWQQERMARGDFLGDLEYWRSELQGAPALLELPSDHARPSALTYRGEVVRREGTPELRRAVEALAQRENATPFMVLLAAFQTLLYRYTQQEDIIVGVPVAGRTHGSVEELIGCFVNTLPIRTMVDGAASFADHLKLVRRKVLDALAHQELPFEHLVNELGVERDLSRSPLFQVMLVQQDTTSADLALSGATASAIPLHNGGAKFDLVLEVTPIGDRYSFALEYSTSLFLPETASRMMRHFTRLLEEACATPEVALSSLSMMEVSEVQHSLSFVNGERAEFARAECLHNWFERRAENSPNALALSYEGRVVTYGELNRRANQVAHHLISRGVGPDVLVGLCIDRSPDLVTGILGILKAGGGYVPIDLSYPPDRLAFIVADAAVSVLLTETKLAASLPYHRAEVICLDDAEAVLAKQPQVNPATEVTPDHTAYVIYTSGSTGKPKGCVITHRNVERLMRATEPWFNFDERDVWTLFHSTAFDFSVWEIWGALLYGGRLVVVPFMVSRSPEAFYELLAKEQVTVLNQTPSAFRQVIQAEEAIGQKELALRYVIFGGEALEMQSLRPWFARHGDQKPRLVNMYGITETTVHVTYRPLSKDDLNSGSVIGVPIPDLQIYILDPQRQPVPIGVRGEMYVGGAGLARGYLNRPELTSERFVPNSLTGRPGERLYRTGDLARFLPGRDIEYLGRIDHQVKIRGFRIELGEIESVLCQHPTVREALVLAWEVSPGTKQLVAYLVADGARPEVKELRTHLKNQVPDYMVPVAFVFLDRFPLTNNGKIDRKALPVPGKEREELGSNIVAPRTPAEKTLAEIWAKVLRLERVGVQHNFFELGGDSILTIQIVSLARQRGLAVSPKLLFQHQTIAELAASVTATMEQPMAEQGLVEGTAPLTPIQHWFFEQELAEPYHYNQAFLFRLHEPFELEPLKRALARLERHHDALRLRIATTSHPREQSFASPSASVPLECVDLSTSGDDELARRIEVVSTQAQARLDFEQGPLFRAVYFDLGRERPGRLLLAIHHLAVDGVSWRILIEDLERAYAQERTGQMAQLPAKTTSVKEWAERLVELVRRGRGPGGTEYWLAFDPTNALPVDLTEGANTEASARTVTVRLSAAETEALLQQAPAAYGTQINDLLLAALGRTLADWAGTNNLRISLEGHGREDLFSGVDLSRTVGWFTTIYPMRLQLPTGGIAELIKSVKEQLRSIPARGIGFGLHRYLAADQRFSTGPEPEIVFNYLGLFDQVVRGSKLFAFASERTGPWHSPLARRRQLLEVNGLVVNGQLELSWTYSENRHQAQTIEQLAQRYLACLREIIRHCTTPGLRGVTASDFPLAALDQRTLDGLLKRVPDLEDVYPLSPIQTLFYTAGAHDSTVVTDHWHGTLSGPLDLERFQQAWESVFERHPALRTSFQFVDVEEPLQVVHKKVKLPWRAEDWRALKETDQTARWAQLLESDRAQGINLAQAPLSRLAVVHLGEQRSKFLWTVPALLLDGWSWPLVFGELSHIYGALCRGTSVALAAALPYRNYIAWIQSRTWDETENFWRRALSGVTEPTPLVAEGATPASADGRRNGEWTVTLDSLLTTRLVSLARQLRLTPNTLIQGAWALVLARLSGRSDVVFGAAFSGRPADLAGVEEIVGPLVNNLPVRVRVNESLSVGAFLQGLHAQLLLLSEHQFAPLARIQSWTDVPWRHRLFDSIVVVQNYLVDEAARRLGDSVTISDFVGPIHTNFPLLVLAEPEAAWRLSLIHDTRELQEAAIRRWTMDLVRALTGFAEQPEAKVTELLARLSAPVRSPLAKRRWRASSQNYVPPQNELEGRLARVWEEMLQLEKISTEENLFDLGAHSLLVVQLHRRLCEAVGKNFPLVTLFRFSTIQSLAKHLNRQDEDTQGHEEIRTRAQRQREALLRLKPAARQR